MLVGLSVFNTLPHTAHGGNAAAIMLEFVPRSYTSCTTRSALTTRSAHTKNPGMTHRGRNPCRFHVILMARKKIGTFHQKKSWPTPTPPDPPYIFFPSKPKTKSKTCSGLLSLSSTTLKDGVRTFFFCPPLEPDPNQWQRQQMCIVGETYNNGLSGFVLDV